MFNKVAVLGLGLLGGSLCKGLKTIDPGVIISAYGRDVNKLKPALNDGSVNTIDTLDNLSLNETELIVVSTPVIISIDIIKNILNSNELNKNALIIDVGSVKEAIIRDIEKCNRADQFIGCHPMAGSEKMGYDYSRSDLYEGASVIITPHEFNKSRDVERIKNFWEMFKAYTIITTPGMHDAYVAYTSHLPHVVSSTLVKLLMDFISKNSSTDEVLPFIGNGFRDVTRISSGSPEMWQDIAVLNNANIINAISCLIDELKNFQNMLSNGQCEIKSIHSFFSNIKQFRDKI